MVRGLRSGADGERVSGYPGREANPEIMKKQ